MAVTTEGAALTAEHRQAQLQIRALALQSYVALWPIWNDAEDEKSFQLLMQAALPLVRSFHTLSSTVAASYFTSFRIAEHIGGTPAPKLAEQIAERQILGTIHVTGIDMTRTAIRAGATPQAAREAALVRTSGTVTRLVLDGGRSSIVESTAADAKALGYARVTSVDPCSFCRLLASRGPVYKADTVGFQAHDHCSCVAEPYYPGSEWPGRGKEFRDEYNEAIRQADAAGELAGANRLNIYRRFLDRKTNAATP